MGGTKPAWVVNGKERSSQRALWQVPLVGEPGGVTEALAAFGLDAKKKRSRALSAADLERLASFLPANFSPAPERDDFEVTNRFVWTAPWVADAAACGELRPVWQAIVDLALAHDARELFEGARKAETSVPWLAHRHFYAPGCGHSDPVLVRVLRDGETWLRLALEGGDEIRACLTPPLLEVLAWLGDPGTERLAVALRDDPSGPWTVRRLARHNVTRALGALISDSALAVLLERPGDSGWSRHPHAGARTLEQALSLAREHERTAGPRRDWPRLRDLVSLGAERRKEILGTALGGERPTGLSSSVAALGKLRYAPAEPFLIDVLEHCPTYLPRQDAIAALAALTSDTAKRAVFERFDEALDGLVGRIAISAVLRWPEGLAMLPRWIGADVDEGLRAYNLENLGEAVAWMAQFQREPPHADAAATVARLLPEGDTRAWFERRFAELVRTDGV